MVRCDVADGRSVCRAVDAARQICGGSITGVLHVAGLLADSTVRAMTDEQFDTVCGPKIEGGWSMHHATLADGLEQFVSYSSFAALLGGLGQSNYCFANGWLDGMCGLRRAGGLRCASVQWGPWADVGMAAARPGLLDGMEADGLVAVEPAVGRSALAAVLQLSDGGWTAEPNRLSSVNVSGCSSMMVPGCVSVFEADWSWRRYF